MKHIVTETNERSSPQYSARSAFHVKALNAYVERLRIMKYSENTQKSYCFYFSKFLEYFPATRPSNITKSEILEYLVYQHKTFNPSASAYNLQINAIKFFIEKILKRPSTTYDLPRARKENKLPVVFTQNEMRSIIMALSNLKHKTMICLAYSSGLRVSEIVNLKVSEIDSGRMVIHITQSKGKKDRQVMLSDFLLEGTSNNLFYDSRRLNSSKTSQMEGA